MWGVLNKPCLSFSPPLQIEVVNTFKSGASFQGALRRQSSTTSQNQDVTNVSSPSHVSLSNALSSPTSASAAAAGRECVFLLPHIHRNANSGPHSVSVRKLAQIMETYICNALRTNQGAVQPASLDCDVLFVLCW